MQVLFGRASRNDYGLLYSGGVFMGKYIGDQINQYKLSRDEVGGVLYITLSILTDSKLKSDLFKPYCREGSDIESLQYMLRDYEDTDYTFWDYIKEKFNQHTSSLIQHIQLKTNVSTSNSMDAQYWDKLFKFQDEKKIKPENIKAVFIFDDDYFFSALGSRSSKINKYQSIEPEIFDSQGVGDYSGVLEKVFANSKEDIDYYFLSGFFQNIIDFMRQDKSEVADGTDPIYPNIDENKTHFLLYSNQNSIYEVVSKSRSLDFGKDWIGTCPYLFLVHIMTFHNESLIVELEKKMIETVRGLKDLGLMTDAFIDKSTADHRQKILNQFRSFKLWLFSNVYMHLYFNSFRYDTERDFYVAISNVRGIQPRQQYWEEIVSKLQNTINDIDEQKRQDDGDKISNIVMAITIFSIFQVLFQTTDVLNKMIDSGDTQTANRVKNITHDISGSLDHSMVWDIYSYMPFFNNQVLINLVAIFLVAVVYSLAKDNFRNLKGFIRSYKSKLPGIVYMYFFKRGNK